MEYRGVYLATGEEIFHFGPILGTNNIGEFLAIVHGLALLEKQQSNIPIYSDSRNALLWIKQKKCKTKLERTPATEEVFNMIERAERWLNSHTYSSPLIKWETSEWGEIPADFGRK
jgi:ribonuclease HI